MGHEIKERHLMELNDGFTLFFSYENEIIVYFTAPCSHRTVPNAIADLPEKIQLNEWYFVIPTKILSKEYPDIDWFFTNSYCKDSITKIIQKNEQPPTKNP